LVVVAPRSMSTKATPTPLSATKRSSGAECNTDRAGLILPHFHDPSAKEEDPDHERAVPDEGGNIRAAEECIDELVDRINVCRHRDGDRDRRVGDAPFGSSAAEDSP
jgi:hypothetical protein